MLFSLILIILIILINIKNGQLNFPGVLDAPCSFFCIWGQLKRRKNNLLYMADLSFRSALLKKDRHTCQNIISYKVTGAQLVQLLNDLIFVSVSTIKNGAAEIHPVCLINSIKNFIGDNRNHPSKVLLEFAVNYLFECDFRENVVDSVIEGMKKKRKMTTTQITSIKGLVERAKAFRKSEV